MSAPTSVASSYSSHTKSIHLLRALLRESSYLPDRVARLYFRRYIVNRFKAYQPSQNATASFDVRAVDKYRHRSFKRRQLSIINERTSQQHQQAIKGLNYLRRANQGSLPCLQRVLFHAYGRVGRRKHALLDSLLKPEPVENTNPLPLPHGPSPLQSLYYSNRNWLQYFDEPKEASKSVLTIPISKRYPRLRAVLRSQAQHGLSMSRPLKGSAMKTNKYNVWMRTMPLKRAVHNVRRWFADTMTRLLPPLPNDEWDHIQAMVLRKKPVSLIPRRTPGTGSTPDHSDTETVHTDDILENLKMNKRSMADKAAQTGRPSQLTAKSLRRLYGRILLLCCKLEYDEARQQWRVIWGEPVPSASVKLYENTPTPSALFDGVDASGKLFRSAEPAPQTGPKIQPRNMQGDYLRFPFYTEFLPRDNPLHKELRAWKAKRAAAGMPLEDGVFRGR